FEVSKAIGTSRDHLHLGVKALRDPVVLGEAPHPSNLFPPGPKRLAQRLESWEGTALELLDASQEIRDQAAAVPCRPVLDQQQPAEALLEAIDRVQARNALEVLTQPDPLIRIQSILVAAHERQKTPIRSSLGI